jgi:hypothetical protein
MWPHWKEGALAVFSRCGLYRVVSNPDFALENPEMNAVVQGMLTIALSKEDTTILYTTVGYADDGHGAWKNVVKYFENPSTYKILIRHNTEEFEKLEVLDSSKYLDFVCKFIYLRERLNMLHNKCNKNKLDTGLNRPKNFK